MRPNHPHDFDFDVDYDHIPDDFLQEDMVVNERHLLVTDGISTVPSR